MPTTLPLDTVEVHRFSLDEYHQLIESGGLEEDSRVELIDGLLADMSPKTREHERAVRWLAGWLALAIDRRRFEVGVGSPLTLAHRRSEPEPDLAVFARDAPAPYHPSTAALVIEVSVSSLARDLGPKASLYASAGIAEYWVVDLRGRRVVVHRDPTDDGYGSVLEVRDNGRITATAFALGELSVGELLAAARA